MQDLIFEGVASILVLSRATCSSTDVAYAADCNARVNIPSNCSTLKTSV